MITGRKMCETIARAIKLETGEDIEPKEIWEQSSTGELSGVFAQYEWAREVLSRHGESPPESMMGPELKGLLRRLEGGESR